MTTSRANTGVQTSTMVAATDAVATGPRSEAAALRGTGQVNEGTDRSFAEKLRALLAAVPREPLIPESRFCEADLLAVLNTAGSEDPEAGGAPAAADWLAASREGAATRAVDQCYLRALTILFRIPADYFDDDELAGRVDARIAFTSAVSGQGVRFIGPCRTWPLDMDSLHGLHVRLVDMLHGHRPASRSMPSRGRLNSEGP